MKVGGGLTLVILAALAYEDLEFGGVINPGKSPILAVDLHCCDQSVGALSDSTKANTTQEVPPISSR
jgi:hypothetical protein